MRLGRPLGATGAWGGVVKAWSGGCVEILMESRDGKNRGVCGFKAVGILSCLALGFVA
jgi:hypothetical protein